MSETSGFLIAKPVTYEEKNKSGKCCKTCLFAKLSYANLPFLKKPCPLFGLRSDLFINTGE